MLIVDHLAQACGGQRGAGQGGVGKPFRGCHDNIAEGQREPELGWMEKSRKYKVIEGIDFPGLENRLGEERGERQG